MNRSNRKFSWKINSIFQASPNLDINEDSNFLQSDDDIDIQNQENDDDGDQNSKIVSNLPQKKEYRKSGITVKRHKMVYRDQPWVFPLLSYLRILNVSKFDKLASFLVRFF